MGMYNLEQFDSQMSNLIKFLSEVPVYAPNFFLTSPNSPSKYLWGLDNSTSLFHIPATSITSDKYDIVQVYFKRQYGVQTNWKKDALVSNKNSVVLDFSIDRITNTLYEIKGVTEIEEYEKAASRYFSMKFDDYAEHQILGHTFFLPRKTTISISEDGSVYSIVGVSTIQDVKVQAPK